jgi:glycosyltransferase involved in cell wall biosynthesis
MRKPINVLLLNYEYPPLGGGAANATKRIIEEYQKMPELHISLVTSSTGSYRVERPSDNIIIYFLDIKKGDSPHYQSNRELLMYTLKSWLFCRKLIKENHYDLIHAFFGIPGGLIALLLGKQYIVSLRGSDVPGYSKRFALLERILFRRLSRLIWRKSLRVVAVSDNLVELAKLTDDKTEYLVIRNGISLKMFKAKREWNNNCSRILFVGRLVKRQGLIYLLEAFSLLSKNYHDITLDIVGNGPLFNEIKDYIADHKLDQKVRLHGMVNHDYISNFYYSSDLFIIPSINEALGNVTLEAMASGLPIITTDTGSAELIEGNGLVIPKKNVQSIYDAIRRYIDNPELLTVEGKKSIKIAKNLTWFNVASEYRELYMQSLDSDTSY